MRLDPAPLTNSWPLLLLAFVRLRGSIRSLVGGMILIVARHSFGNLFGSEFAVILGMQNVRRRSGIGGHDSKSSLSFSSWTSGNPAGSTVLPVPVENSTVLRRVGQEPAFWPAWRERACRNSEENPRCTAKPRAYCTARRDRYRSAQTVSWAYAHTWQYRARP